MVPVLRLAAAVCLLAPIAGCGPDYSPNTYSTASVQQANKVDKGVIVGVRQIDVTAPGMLGAATGAAAGGVVGANTPGGGLTTAFGAIGGGLIGGIVGSAAEHATSDTTAFEYIVRKPNGDLVSVTQKDAVALAVGQHVLVIAGNQARIVPDYTVNPEPPPAVGGSAPPPLAAPPATVVPPPNAPPASPAATPSASTEPPPVPVSASPLAPAHSPQAPAPAGTAQTAPTPLTPP